MKSTFSQSLDIHSSKILKEEQEILIYCDSLGNVDYQKSLDFSLFVLHETRFSQKPSIYNALVYKAIVSAYHLGRFDIADSLSIRLQSIPQNNIHPNIIADLLYHQALALRVAKKYINALELAKEAQIIYLKSNEIEGQVKLQILLMNLYKNIQNNDLAYEYYKTSQTYLAKKINNEYKLKLVKEGAQFLILNKRYGEAWEQLELASELCQLVNDELSEARVLFLKGLFYFHQKNYSKSEAYFNQSLDLSRKSNNSMFMAKLYTYQAAIARRTKEYSSCLKYNRMAFNLRIKANSKYLSASSLINIASSMMSLQQYDSAHYYLNKGEEQLFAYGTEIDLMRVQNLRQDLLLQQNNYKDAFYALETAMQMQDSLFQQESLRKINELKSSYESGKFEHQKEEIEAETIRQTLENKRNALMLRLILIVILLSLLASYLVYLYSISRNKRRLISLNQQMVMIQMNSHFVFNALTAIQSLIYKNQIESAIYYLTHFSSLINRILSISYKQNISLQAELSFVKEFLKIQKLRFGDILKYQIEVAEDLELTKILLPPLLSYPYLEYAAEECVQQSESETMILIKLYKDNKYLIYEIVDMGLGFSDLEKSYIKRYGGQRILCQHFTEERISLSNHILKTKVIFAKNIAEYEGDNYPMLQFKIKM